MKFIPGWIIVFIITGLMALGGLGFWYWGAPSGSVGPHDGPVEKITVSTGTDAKSALLFIAQHYGYFSRHGLEVTLTIHPSGKIACQELRAGAIDIANAADFVVVESVFAGFKSLRCFGGIAAADDILVIARKDRGIQTPGDLRGKRIAVPLGTVAEFFLNRFLTFHSLTLRDVKVVDSNPGGLEEALASGKVDSVIIWERYGVPIKKRLGDQVISWPGQGGQKYYWLLVGTEALAASRPQVLERLFRALEQAEKFLQSHPKEAIGIIAGQINVDPAVVEAAWKRSTYALSLDQALLITMEDEARWMIGNKLTDQNRVPNFLHYLNGELLTRVNPRTVGIVFPKNRK
jgi:ABC-type nitrate/sulfonate/bicarbonate transport system substrate-binding protein